jgi:hypothetical protein
MTHRIKYPYPDYKKEIEYRGERAYLNEFGMWTLYNPDFKPRTADTLQGLKAIVNHKLDIIELPNDLICTICDCKVYNGLPCLREHLAFHDIAAEYLEDMEDDEVLEYYDSCD